MSLTERQKRYYASEKGKAKKSPYTEEARKELAIRGSEPWNTQGVWFTPDGSTIRRVAFPVDSRPGWWKTSFVLFGFEWVYFTRSMVKGIPTEDPTKAAEAFQIVEAARKAIWKK